MRALAILLLAAGLAWAEGGPRLRPDPPMACAACAEWNAPQEPYRVFGDTYVVGPQGLGAVLLVSGEGLILLDGGLTQSAAVIDAGIRKLGFRIEDLRLILNSHAHFDHAGGIAALQRASGAVVAASAAGARALQVGLPTPDDPQIAFGKEANAFPRIEKVRVVADGETVRVGPLAVTARYTPGHTPGSTTWTWRSCEGERCLDVVYADSLNAVAAPGFRFSGDGKRPSLAASFRSSVARVAALPCDVLLTVHPSFARMGEKAEQRARAPEPNPFVDPKACREYAAAAGERLEARLAEEAAGRP